MYQRRGAYIFNDWQEAAPREHDSQLGQEKEPSRIRAAALEVATDALGGEPAAVTQQRRRQHSVPTTRATKIQTKHEKRLNVALNSRVHGGVILFQ
ncbi:MAG: hypothetical protein WBQ54_17600 [Pseudolabrys sp.]